MRSYAIVGAASMMTALAAALTLTAWDNAVRHEQVMQTVDPLTSGSIASDTVSDTSDALRLRFTVSNLHAGTVCLVERDLEVSKRSSHFLPEGDCEAVWPGLATARNWIENDDGSVTLADAEGAQVLLIEAARGFDYATIEPSGVDITWLQIQ